MEASNGPQSRRAQDHHKTAAYLGCSYIASGFTFPSPKLHNPASPVDGPASITVLSDPTCQHGDLQHFNGPDRHSSLRAPLHTLCPTIHSKSKGNHMPTENGNRLCDQHLLNYGISTNRDQEKISGSRS